ncbi:FAD-binding oxidoreductase [Actinocrispum wychmicini]|uniref:FAD/FMN-containing dehydrogenase n=1 Tax=Actinocrispum wychmicini TaxID=1213861 RepID=A0A4V2S5R5_9PSEU|nr:FAD-binding oxidoreductase [Actinocrispum wychmicini]TCO53170.1 FAD/FMN-containing dehydrogenase [Actinocrispum wychmicini]
MNDVGRRRFLAGAGAAVAVGAVSGTGVLAGTAQADEQSLGLPATTVKSGDARYVDMVRGSNQRWVGNPDVIRVCNSTDQVVAAVQDAVNAGKRIGVRSGGHCYENFVYEATQVVIDVSELDQVGYDPVRNAISVGAGANLFQVYDALYRVWGVIIPGGSCGTVGAGGHITGGGYGLNSRQFGLTVDYLYGVEVVTVDAAGKAKVIVATRDGSDRDLWWAHTGGGGGNFGVVTRFLLKATTATGTDPSTFLPRPPAELFINSVALDWKDVTEENFTRLVDNYGKWHERNSAPDSPYDGIFGLLKLNKKTWDADRNVTGQIVLLTQADASRPNAQQLLDTYLAAVFDGVDAPRVPMSVRSGEHAAMPHLFKTQRLPWLHGTFELSGGPSWTLRSDYKSAYLRKGHTAEQIAATYKWLATPDYNNGNALVQIDSYGCRVNAVGSADTAVPQRDSVLKLQYQVYWEDPAEDAQHLNWFRNFYSEVYASTGGVPVPNAVTDGCYVNYPDIDLQDPSFNRSGVPWSTLYYKGNYPRLRQVKDRYDPRNTFRHRQSIEP